MLNQIRFRLNIISLSCSSFFYSIGLAIIFDAYSQLTRIQNYLNYHYSQPFKKLSVNLKQFAV